MLRDFPLREIVPYIDWSPFFMTWELKRQVSADPSTTPRSASEARELFDDAQRLLERIIEEKLLTANAVYGFFPANSDGDDIVVFTDESADDTSGCASRCFGSSGSARGKRPSAAWPTTSRRSRAG